jgi:hypothetical protein
MLEGTRHHLGQGATVLVALDEGYGRLVHEVTPQVVSIATNVVLDATEGKVPSSVDRAGAQV